ncbi:glycosyltransferase [Dyella flagellata]|uniref:Glycosyltransferase subfamily 4-like N-terminal domain-containing protein n=1 Tax=Dyella flagellata TaxID=1867833 RepID=A0ABQ5XA67_9GAMM|nr:glycosyltransferase [Dyella flagellata]GLQ88529.1 hypothetical protein GCM10007898_20990 [Dyella flagellata]
MMSVLFIGKRYYTNRDAFTEKYGRIYQLPWHWSRSGLPVRLWLLDYHGRTLDRRSSEELEVVSTPLRGIGWLAQCFRQAALRFSSKRPTIVVASGDCYIGMLGFLLARWCGARFVFDVYDKYDEFGGFRRPLGFDPFRYLLKRADANLFASRSLMESLGASTRMNLLVPNGVDQERFHPLDKLASRRALTLPEQAVFVGYFGSMEPDRGIPDLIAAVQILRAQGSPIELLLGGRLGEGINPHQDGVRYVGNVPFADVPPLLASCDVLAIPYRRSAFMDAAASVKIAEALACGQPLVATMTPNLIANFPAQAAALEGRLAEPGNAADLARVMALQLGEPTYSTLPENMAWSAIAALTSVSLGLADAPSGSFDAKG